MENLWIHRAQFITEEIRYLEKYIHGKIKVKVSVEEGGGGGGSREICYPAESKISTRGRRTRRRNERKEEETER